MRPTYLSRTAIGILKVMVSDLTKEYTIRSLAARVGQSYRITYETVQALVNDGDLRLEKRANHNACRLNLAKGLQSLAFIESLRAEEFLKTKTDLRVVVSSVVSRISAALPFFTLILFGSHVKRTSTPRSDLDMVLLIPGRVFQHQVENELASIARTSTTGLHELILTSQHFASLLSTRQGKGEPNVATEILESHIIPHGAEAFYSLVSGAL